MKWLLPALMLVSSVAVAAPCPDQAPRFYPVAGSTVPPDTRIVILVRRELADALNALQHAHLALAAEHSTIPLVRDSHDRDLRSDQGEFVLIFRPARKLKVGQTYSLTHLPKLPDEWQVLSQASWVVDSAARKAKTSFDGITLGRTLCVALSSDARVCRITLNGENGGPVSVLLQATLSSKDPQVFGKGQPRKFVEIIAPGNELALHNTACDAEMSGLPGGKYDVTLQLIDAAGHAGSSWKTGMNLVDMNEAMNHPIGEPPP